MQPPSPLPQLAAPELQLPRPQLINMMGMVRLRKDEAVITQGEVLGDPSRDCFYVVAEGSLNIHRAKARGCVAT